MVAVMMALALAGMQAEPGVPPVMVPMVAPAAIEGAPLRQPVEPGYICTAGYADCVRIIRSGEDGQPQLAVFDMDAAAADIPAVPLPGGVGADDGMDIEVWDRAIRLPSGEEGSTGARGYFIGVIRRTPVSYSGGFASGERLHLFRLTIVEGGAALGPELVSLPWTTKMEIRACFGEDDGARRRGACHDEFEYTATLAVAPDERHADAMPMLTYSSLATAYPRTARRSEDSSAQPPLTEADLTIWRDPECSYARTLRYNPATERYEMDAIAPDCGAYTSP